MRFIYSQCAAYSEPRAFEPDNCLGIALVVVGFGGFGVCVMIRFVYFARNLWFFFSSLNILYSKTEYLLLP